MIGWGEMEPPQNTAEAYPHHRMLWEKANMSLCKVMPNPEARYASVVESHDVEVKHAPQASGHPSAGEWGCSPRFQSGNSWTVTPFVRTEAAMEDRLLVVVDGGGAWFKENRTRHSLEKMFRSIGFKNTIVELIHGVMPRHVVKVIREYVLAHEGYLIDDGNGRSIFDRGSNLLLWTT